MPMVTLPLDGGLDLVNPPITVAPGRLQACENFEVALTQGYKSIDGYERYDGGASPSSGSSGLWVAFITAPYVPGSFELLTTNFFATGQISFPYQAIWNSQIRELVCDIIYTETEGLSNGRIYFTTRSFFDSQIAKSIFIGIGPGITAPYVQAGDPTAIQENEFVSFDVDYVNPNVEVADEAPTVALQLLAEKTYYDEQRTFVQQVPGQQSVLGLFWLKDFLYAVRDYLTLAYDTETVQSNPGEELFQGASYAARTWSGILIRDSVNNADVTTGDASGVYMFADTEGTPVIGPIYNHDQADVQVAEITAVTGTAAQGAGLYKATGDRVQGAWVHQDIGWTVLYKDAQAPFQRANRLAPDTPVEDLIISTDWFVPDAQVTNAGWGVVGATAGQVWEAVQSDDDDTSYALRGMNSLVNGLPAPVSVSPAFWINQFGISETDLPDGSAVTGIEVEINRRAYAGASATGGSIRDNTITLRFPSGGPEVSFADTATNWPQSTTNPDNPNYAVAQYGGPQNLLGYGAVSPSSLRSSDFGLRMSVQCVGYTQVGPVLSPTPDGANSITPHITLIRIRVYYVPPQPGVYFWNGTSAVLADVVTAYQQSGNPNPPDNDGAGVLYLMNVGTNRPVLANEEIRSLPAAGVTPDGGATDGSTLIALTAVSMEKNVMDWSGLLTGDGREPNRSKYQYDVSNFYAAADFDAIYGVSGAGPAFMYDGIAFTRILTGTPLQDDKPRHVRVHQSRLFLGYPSGSVQYSEPGDPLTFDALTGTSGEISVGAAVRGLMQLSGDALAIIHQKGVSMIQGDVGLGPYLGIISPDVGCVEYSAQSMGQFMYTSFRGVQNLRATQAYGDFDTAQFSWDVWSWLRPRVQTSAFFESAPIGVINSLAVRNKSQYRLMFADGYQLTGTFLREGEMPQYTIQRYTRADGITPHTWDVVTAGVESNGRDRLFGAMDDESGYVYEIDRGKSFDGGNITAFFTLTFDDGGEPETKKTYIDATVHGMALGYSSFTVSRAENYEPATAANSWSHHFGNLADPPITEPRPYFSSNGIRLHGRNIAYRFNWTHNDQYPVTIQAISNYLVTGGQKRS